MFKEYFVEATEQLSRLTSAELKHKLRDLGLMMSCTPSIELAEGLHLTYCRISDIRGNNEAFDDRTKEAIDRFDGVIVAQSFDELWDTYERSAEYFVVDVKLADGSKQRLPLAGLERQHEVIDNIARAPGIFLGGPDLQKELDRNTNRAELQERVSVFIDQVRGANELTEDERDNILGYLDAVSAILRQPNPDKVALRVLLTQMGKRIASYSVKLGERYVTGEILAFIKDFLGSNLPF